MNDTREIHLAFDEDAQRKAWCDPALVEYDLDEVTAIGGVTAVDGGFTSSR